MLTRTGRLFPTALLTTVLTGCLYVSGDAHDDMIKDRFDADGDGELSEAAGGMDCDDTDPAINPLAPEVCNGADDDCNGQTDDEDAGVTDAATWYADTDSDTYGDPANDLEACDEPAGYVANKDDCDDADPLENPDAIWYADVDGDGFGDAAVPIEACAQPADHVLDNTDCNDADAAVNPDSVWYADADGDGFGAIGGLSTGGCDPGVGWVLDETDCDDTEELAYPSSEEFCDTFDNDCDGDIDEPDAVDALTWYADTDGDTFGDAAATQMACDQPTGFVADDTDCDDTDDAVLPGGLELCGNLLDDDCDGGADSTDPEAGWFYEDRDGDLWGDMFDMGEFACADDPRSGFVFNQHNDCDDNNNGVNPTIGNCTLAGGISDNSPSIVLGEQAGSFTGFSAAGLGDVNGDDAGDIVIAAPGQVNPSNGQATGVLFGFEGPVSGTSLVDAAQFTILGGAQNDFLGFKMSTHDDDDDGSADLLVSAPGAGGNDGAVYLFEGPIGTDRRVADANAVFVGSGAVPLAGGGVVTLADFNGDGHADALIGEFDGESTLEAQAYLNYGPFSSNHTLGSGDDAKITPEPTDGWALGAHGWDAGDLNGDGIHDIALADPVYLGGMGRVYFFTGTMAGTVNPADADRIITSDVAGGTGISGSSGDHDGDGLADQAIGAPFAENGQSCANQVGPGNHACEQGAVFVVSGDDVGVDAPLSALSYLSIQAQNTALQSSDQYFGSAADLRSDVDGDGMNDLLVGAPGYGGWAIIAWTYEHGHVQIWRGGRSGSFLSTDGAVKINEPDHRVNYGNFIGALGDLNRDGIDDWFVGAPLWETSPLTPNVDSGRGHIYYGLLNSGTP